MKSINYVMVLTFSFIIEVRLLRLTRHVDRMDASEFEFVVALNNRSTGLWTVTPCSLIHTILSQKHASSTLQKKKYCMLL
jgi:hypothetical protein